MLGTVKHPLNSSDFSSFLLQAQASKAKIVGLANAGGDTTNSIKQAAEFGIVKGGQRLAGLLLFITDVHSLGLNVAQGLNFTETFYWDLNDDTRAFGKRFSDRTKSKAQPSMVQAGVYSGLIHYFKALEAMGGNPHDGAKVVAKMKEMPTDDPAVRQGFNSRRWTQDSPGLSVRSEEAVGVQGTVGLLQAGRHHSRGSGVPAAVGKFLPAGEEVTMAARRPRAGGHPPRRHPRLECERPIVMQALYAQLLVGLINGSFYALLSLGLAVIFGMLNIINFAHGALYMMGAFCAYFLLNLAGIGYWPALILAPIAVGIFGMILERTMLQWLSGLDHLYGLLLTFGLALIIQGVFQNYFGSSGLPYAIPDELKGGMNLGFMFLPIYRGWVVVFSLVVCLLTWYLIERTRLGANLRAATENPTLVRAFGINVPRMITLTYGLGVGLAALAGVLSAPINQVRPLMGADLIIVVFAVVVIGGMGSIMGSIITGFALGVIEGLTKYFYPEASNTVVFVLMVLVLLVKPSGLTGRAA